MIILQTAGALQRAYMGQDDTHEVDAAYPAVADRIWTPILQFLMDLGQVFIKCFLSSLNFTYFGLEWYWKVLIDFPSALPPLCVE
jgi:hypothetical protein